MVRREVTWDDIKKLKKQDREDYFFRTKILRESRTNYAEGVAYMTKYLVEMIAFILILFPLYTIAFGKEVIIKFIPTITLFFDIFGKIFSVVVAILLLMAIFEAVFYRKHRNQILEDYFDFKTEVKK